MGSIGRGAGACGPHRGCGGDVLGIAAFRHRFVRGAIECGVGAWGPQITWVRYVGVWGLQAAFREGSIECVMGAWGLQITRVLYVGVWRLQAVI